jgi:hypothetical protein
MSALAVVRRFMVGSTQPVASSTMSWVQVPAPPVCSRRPSSRCQRHAETGGVASASRLLANDAGYRLVAFVVGWDFLGAPCL